MSHDCSVALPWVCVQFVIVVYPDHTHYFLSCRDPVDKVLNMQGLNDSLQLISSHFVGRHQLYAAYKILMGDYAIIITRCIPIANSVNTNGTGRMIWLI